MKRTAVLLLLALCAALAVIAGPEAVSAQPPVEIKSSVASTAPAIVNATVQASQTVELDGEVYTVYIMQADHQVKGSVPTNFLLETPGGQRADGSWVLWSHTPTFLSGDTVQLALEPGNPMLGSALGFDADPAGVIYALADSEHGVAALGLTDAASFAAVPPYVLSGFDVPAFPRTFEINAANSGLSASATRAAVRRGFYLWENDPGSAVDFTYGGITSKTGLGSDQIAVVSWQSPNSSNGLGTSLGRTYISFSSATGYEFDIIMNSNYNWSNGISGTKFDIGTVVAHEVGHGLGLTHVVGPPIAPGPAELMYFQIPSSTIKLLGNGDKQGINSLYPKLASLSSPSPGATLPCGAATFGWTGSASGSWAVHVGSSVGASDFGTALVSSVKSATVTGLPTSGSVPVHVRLWNKVSGGSWAVVDDAVYTSCALNTKIWSPPPGGQLACGGTATFIWSNTASGSWAVHVGSSPGAQDYGTALVSSTKTASVSGIPRSGSVPVYVRLWNKAPGGSWVVVDDVEYVSCAFPISINSPTAGSILPCGTATFSWGGTASGSWAIYAGSTLGGNEFGTTLVSSLSSATVSGLPTGGSGPVYIRLWRKPGGGSWSVIDDAVYTACT